MMMESHDEVKIAVDNRETAEFDVMLERAGASVERRQLEVGDFVCSSRCIVERKTRDDFEASIVDGRLFTQLPNLIANYGRVIIIVEGERNDGEGRERLGKSALLGAYASVITDFGAALFFTRSIEKTAELVYAIAKHEQRTTKSAMRLSAKRKTHTLSQNQRSVIEMLPMIGPKQAKNLLEHFGNIQNLANATEKELMEVEGMGEKRAKAVWNALNEKYEPEEDEIREI